MSSSPRSRLPCTSPCTVSCTSARRSTGSCRAWGRTARSTSR
jgi:hypothetical protein